MKGALTQLAFATALLLVPAYAQDPGQAPTKVEEDPRAKAIREAYEEQLRRESQMVSISKRNATLDEIVEEFRRQTGINIILDKRNIPDDYRIDEFIVQNEPFANALKALAHKAELTIENVSATLIRLSRPPRVTFNFRDADIKVVIDMIARVSGANIIVSPDVKGSITLSINNVPWNEVLTSVVKTLGFTTVQENFGIIRIIHPDELLKQMDIRTYTLKHIQPPPLYTAKLEETKFISGRPIQPPTQIEEILRRFVLKQVLETVLSKTAQGQLVGKLDFDPQTNSVIVRDTKIVLDKIQEIINLLDVEPQQVLIDIKFISTTNEDLLQFGTNWSFAGQPGAGISTTVLDPSSGLPAGIPGTGNGKVTKLPFGFGKEVGNPGDQFFLTDFEMSMTFRAFKRDRFTRLIQEPTIAVLDNTEATIFVGDTISYAETRASTSQLGTLEFSVAEAAKSPVKVGFQLFVIPKVILETNKIILTVIPQNEVLVPGNGVAGLQRFSIQTASGVTQNIDLPHIRTSTLVTKLILESGRTAILGGLVLERTTFQDEGIPILKDIPIINYLFKQRNDTSTKEHLLIFVTPRIVRGGRASTEGLRDLLKLREEAERREFEDAKRRGAAGEMKK